MRWVVVLFAAFCIDLNGGSAQHVPGGGSSSASVRVEAGTKVYQGHCAMCHSILPGATLVGPSLSGVMTGPDAAQVRTIILNGKGRMRGLKGQLTQQDINNVLAYLKTL